jgi:hypothetical protein
VWNPIAFALWHALERLAGADHFVIEFRQQSISYRHNSSVSE